MLNLFLDLRNINQNDEQTQIFICFIRVQLMALDIRIWVEVFFGSIRYARFASIPVWKSIRFSGTSLARYPTFRYATRSMAYILHTYQHVPVHSTFYMRLSSRLQTLCTYVPMYRTVHYLLHIKYCQTASTLESSLVESLVSSLQSLCSLQSTVRYPIPYSMSYIVDRTSYRLRGVLDTIFATCIVARVQPQYATYRTGKARSVSTIVQPLGQDPYLDTNPSLTTVQSSVF